MRFKTLFSMLLASGALMPLMAQTHVEGMEYYKADQFGNAKELLERNYNNPGTDKSVSDYYLGLIDLSSGNQNDAAAHFNKGAQANPDFGYNYVGLGAIQLKNGNIKEAETLFKGAEKASKKDAALQIAIARAYYDADPVAYAKEIEKRVEKARRIKMESPAIYIFEGDVLADKKDWGGAAAKYEMAANYDNNATEAYVKYANLFTQVNPQYAIKMLSRLLELHPNSALAQRELANAYYNNKDFANAAKHYGAYVNNPNHFKQDEDRYAFLLFYGQNFKQGYDYASNLLKSNPGNFNALRYQFINAAQMPEMQSQTLPMAEAVYAAHKASPENKIAAIDFTLIADEFQRAKKFDEAVEVLEEAMTVMPENANFNKQLAMAYVDRNNIASAADAYAGYIAKTEEPGYNDFIQQATFDFYAGVETKATDKAKSDAYFEDALKYADKAAAILPDNYKPVKFHGDVAKQKAEGKEAIETAAAPMYEKAIVMLEASQDPSRYASDAKEMYNYMGNFYLDKKDVAKAKEFFGKYLNYDPDNADYRKFVEGLK